jgi:hypothetical protein
VSEQRENINILFYKIPVVIKLKEKRPKLIDTPVQGDDKKTFSHFDETKNEIYVTCRNSHDACTWPTEYACVLHKLRYSSLIPN